MPDDYTMGDLARQDIYPDERGFQPPVDPLNLPPEAYASLGGGDLGLLGSKGIAGLFNKPSWLQQAQDVTQKDVANYQTGGVPAVIGALAENSQPEQDLSGGFGGNIKGVKAPVVPGALAALDTYHPPFYSAVERAVQDAKQTTAPGQQWAGFLRNQPGVKPEEVETLGLGKLFEQPTVPRQTLLDQIAANKVNVGEVMKGLPYDASKITVKRVGDGPNAYWESFDNTGTMITRHPGSMSEAQALGDAQTFANIGPQSSTKFSSYTLPGGENYREMLLTLPSPNDNYIAAVDKMKAKYGDKPLGQMPMTDAERALIDKHIDAYGDTGGTFKSSHFDEPNVLAHVRYNDRVIDGKKTLFVEEVQSDWHQAGKKRGYKSEPPPAEPTGKWQVTQTNPDGTRIPYSAFDTQAEAEAWADRVRGAHREATVAPEMTQPTANTTGVPDVPFKTTWPDLAMKRVIREAAEKGYDKVAWTPGSVQADRYDLSKQVDKISSYRLQKAGELELKDGQPQYRIEAFKDGKLAADKYVTENELADHVGKELADKIVKQENGAHSYSGLDLKVGGEGMKGFYDEILPATVNKLVKKHGARVEQGEVDISGGRPTQYANFDAFLAGKKPQPVHTIDITPSLRAAAMKGFPLFTAGGVAATGMMGDLAKQDDYQ